MEPNEIAEVSKKWFRLRDSYGVQIDPGRHRSRGYDGPRRSIVEFYPNTVDHGFMILMLLRTQ